eukprot:2449281-Amphidinium_carterae.1
MEAYWFDMGAMNDKALKHWNQESKQVMVLTEKLEEKDKQLQAFMAIMQEHNIALPSELEQKR